MAFEYHEAFMERCLQLAQKGIGMVAPNPLVGALLVYNGKIIGEGWHQAYGGPHAEVNCFDSVSPEDKWLIRDSILYVSLEPCAHYGKTPPCSLRIIQEGVSKVVVGMGDPFSSVNGLGIQQLVAAGIDVVVGVLQKECEFQNRRFLCFFTKNRPYIHLKWAQTADGHMASEEGMPRMMITNPNTARLVHKWRSEEAAVLIGTRTALTDNPFLDARYWTKKPIKKILIDRNLKVSLTNNLFEEGSKVWIINGLINKQKGNINYLKADLDSINSIDEILNLLLSLNVQSVLVEGGGATIQGFINTGLWDEAHILTNTKMISGCGLKAPELTAGLLKRKKHIGDDKIEFYLNI